ncbi:MAG: phosphoribosylaminoimidazolesuccinocarboxamide synthase, partial [Acidimicrobiales bacterium]
MTPAAIDLAGALGKAFGGLDPSEVADLGSLTRGKVRDLVDLGDRVALVTTDRLSAFDRVLGTVPYRGQVLNQLAAWWFERVADIVAGHVLAVPDPNVTIARRCTPLPVEVVVRGHLSGSTSTSLWTSYRAGAREIHGVRLADGMVKNDPLPHPVITPTTKATTGSHDEPISQTDVVQWGLVDADRWEEIRAVALALFARGRELARDAGLVLVDTKYEFGLDERGRLTLIDEVHTPDSSRFWRAGTAERRRRAGVEPEHLDKEIVRLAYAERGYRGDGEPPALPPDLAERAAAAYLEAFRLITGAPIDPARYPAAPRVLATLSSLTAGRSAVRAVNDEAREDEPR